MVRTARACASAAFDWVRLRLALPLAILLRSLRPKAVADAANMRLMKISMKYLMRIGNVLVELREVGGIRGLGGQWDGRQSAGGGKAFNVPNGPNGLNGLN